MKQIWQVFGYSIYIWHGNFRGCRFTNNKDWQVTNTEIVFNDHAAWASKILQGLIRSTAASLHVTLRWTSCESIKLETSKNMCVMAIWSRNYRIGSSQLPSKLLNKSKIDIQTWWVYFSPLPLIGWTFFPNCSDIFRACDENHDDGQELQETHPNQSVPGMVFTKSFRLNHENRFHASNWNILKPLCKVKHHVILISTPLCLSNSILDLTFQLFLRTAREQIFLHGWIACHTHHQGCKELTDALQKIRAVAGC